MVKFLVKASLLVFLAGSIPALPSVHAADTPGARPADQPHRVAVIDMARVFKSYTKFSALREELKGDLQKSEERFKKYAADLQKLQQEMKGFKEGSEEYAKTEKAILTLQTTAEAYRKGAQRDLVRREAQIYKTIYLEVSDAIAKYASYRNYTLVLRFSADEVESTENPEEVMRGLNRWVVYYRPSDDITNTIVKYLNKQYDTATHTSDAAPARN